MRQARSEHGDQRDRQQDAGKRHQDVDRPADHVVHGTAEVAGDRAERHAEERRHRNHGEADEERDTRAGDEAREDVTPELVETERVRSARRLEPLRQDLRRRIIRRQRRPQRRDENRDENDGEPDPHHSKRILGSRNP